MQVFQKPWYPWGCLKHPHIQSFDALLHLRYVGQGVQTMQVMLATGAAVASSPQTTANTEVRRPDRGKKMARNLLGATRLGRGNHAFEVVSHQKSSPGSFSARQFDCQHAGAAGGASSRHDAPTFPGFPPREGGKIRRSYRGGPAPTSPQSGIPPCQEHALAIETRATRGCSFPCAGVQTSRVKPFSDAGRPAPIVPLIVGPFLCRNPETLD